jgi:hypothetical protein
MLTVDATRLRERMSLLDTFRPSAIRAPIAADRLSFVSAAKASTLFSVSIGSEVDTRPVAVIERSIEISYCSVCEFSVGYVSISCFGMISFLTRNYFMSRHCVNYFTRWPGPPAHRDQLRDNADF